MYILKQLFFSISVNSGFRNMYLAASRLGKLAIYVSLLRGALIPSHPFTFNIGNRQGRAVSRVQFDTI